MITRSVCSTIGTVLLFLDFRLKNPWKSSVVSQGFHSCSSRQGFDRQLQNRRCATASSSVRWGFSASWWWIVFSLPTVQERGCAGNAETARRHCPSHVSWFNPYRFFRASFWPLQSRMWCWKQQPDQSQVPKAKYNQIDSSLILNSMLILTFDRTKLANSYMHLVGRSAKCERTGMKALSSMTLARP